MPLGLLTSPNQHKLYPVHLVARYFKVRTQVIKGLYRKKGVWPDKRGEETKVAGSDFGWIGANLSSARSNSLLRYRSKKYGAFLVLESQSGAQGVTVMPEKEPESPSLQSVLSAFEYAIANYDVPTVPVEESLQDWAETERKIEEAELKLKGLTSSS